MTLYIFVCSGTASFTISDKQIPLTGPHSIIGRAVVVHGDPDDLGKGNLSLTSFKDYVLIDDIAVCVDE